MTRTALAHSAYGFMHSESTESDLVGLSERSACEYCSKRTIESLRNVSKFSVMALATCHLSEVLVSHYRTPASGLSNLTNPFYFNKLARRINILVT